MGIISILLVAKDLDFAWTFAHCISNKNPEMLFNVVTEKDFQSSSIEKFDLIIADEVTENQIFDAVLAENKLSCDADSFPLELYKYDNTDVLAKRLHVLYCTKTGRTISRSFEAETQIIAFYSTGGGTGKTAVTLGLAQELVRFHNKNVLYVNFEEIESTSLYFKKEEGRTIEHYLYYMNKDCSMCTFAEAFTTCDVYGVKAFSPSKGRNPLKILNTDEVFKFFALLQEQNEFHYILVDCNHDLNENTLSILSMCDQICMVEKEIDTTRSNQLKQYLDHQLGSNITNKMITVKNFHIDSETEQIADETTIVIDRDDESFRTDAKDQGEPFFKICIDKDFGAGIKRLSTNLTLNLQ